MMREQPLKEQEQTKQMQDGESGGGMQGEQPLAGEEENKWTQGSDSERMRREQPLKEQEQTKQTQQSNNSTLIDSQDSSNAVSDSGKVGNVF